MHYHTECSGLAKQVPIGAIMLKMGLPAAHAYTRALETKASSKCASTARDNSD